MSLIKKIRIKNFKSLEDVEIEMNQLTFLFGPNSSGKSSFIKALMFLSKNLFPLNTGKTIYKISDDVDLGSYKDIVANGDIGSTIVFEIEIKGSYEFPILDVFQPEKIRDALLKEYLEKLSKKTFFHFFEETLRELMEINYETNSFLNKQNCEILFRVELRYDENDCNLDSFTVHDKINNSIFRYFHDSEIWKTGKSEMENESKKLMRYYINFLGNNDLSILFERILPFDAYFEPHFFGDTFFGAPFVDEYVNLPIVPTIDEVLHDDFNKSQIPGVTRNSNIIYPDWERFSKFEKLKLYYEVLNFTYVIYRLAPHIIYNFLSYFHLPTVRKIPQRRYFLDNAKFNKSEYYGLLDLLDSGQFQFLCENNAILLENGNQLGELIKKNEDQKTNSFSFLIGNQKEQIFLLTNHYLTKFKFNYTLRIDKNIEIGKILLLQNSGKLVNLSSASSGLIQVLPILICCAISRTEIFDDNPWRFKSEYFIFNPSANCGYSLRDKDELSFETLLIEQPELHLHPKLQSQLAELFADTVNKTNTSGSLIIETHSEHLIRKIQVLIAKGELDKGKVGVWYFDNSEGTTKIKEMRIEPNGFFKEPWPNGFFDDSANLSWELLTANKN